ncbi:CHAT domain-containing protein [Sulfidibacter corallicola]
MEGEAGQHLWGYVAAESGFIEVNITFADRETLAVGTQTQPLGLVMFSRELERDGPVQVTVRAKDRDAEASFVFHARLLRMPSEHEKNALLAFEEASRDRSGTGDHRGAWLAAQRVFEHLDEPAAALVCGFMIGQAARRQGDWYRARWHWAHSLGIATPPHCRGLRSRVLAEMAVCEKELGYFADALAHLQEARDLRKELDMPRRAASCRFEEGFIHTIVGELDQAETDYRSAAETYRNLNLIKYEQTILSEVGWLAFRRKNYEKAHAMLGDVWQIAQKHGWEAWFNGVWDRQGTVLTHMERYREALQAYEKAREGLKAATSAPVPHAVIHANLAGLYLAWGKPDQARSSCLEGLNLLPDGVALETRASLLWRLSQTYEKEGLFHQALEAAKDSVFQMERLRARSGARPPGYAVFQAGFEFVEHCFHLFFELHRAEPEGGHDMAALLFLERVRARGLLARLAQRPRRFDGETRPGQRGSQAGRPPVGEAPTIPEERREAFETAPLAKIRELVIGEDNIGYFFLLGEEQGYAWKLTRDGLTLRPLPPRHQIETMLAAFRSAIETPSSLHQGRRQYWGTRLSELLFMDVTAADSERRLLIFPDGGLFDFPFAALPPPYPRKDPTTHGQAFLIERHPIVVLPSASYLVHLRTRGRPRPQSMPLRKVLVFADPVFDSEDKRLEHVRRNKVSPSGFVRLEASEQELKHLQTLVASRYFRGYGGFEATRKQLLKLDLTAFDVIHLATHGVSDPLDPARSGIVLSQRNPIGGEIDGFINATDIRRQKLSADLVVLSACRSAQGRYYQGEGVVGFARSFLEAGAGAVVASTWNVNDKATAQLMKVFYNGLYQKGLTIEEALRQAQRHMAQGPFRKKPSFWAGFFFCGDWEKKFSHSHEQSQR